MAAPDLISFVVRFARDDAARSPWRGRILHVQSDQEQYFTSFEEAVAFMQARVSTDAPLEPERVAKRGRDPRPRRAAATRRRRAPK